MKQQKPNKFHDYQELEELAWSHAVAPGKTSAAHKHYGQLPPPLSRQAAAGLQRVAACSTIDSRRCDPFGGLLRQFDPPDQADQWLTDHRQHALAHAHSGAGEPLPDRLRHESEQKTDTDLREVRVHTSTPTSVTRRQRATSGSSPRAGRGATAGAGCGDKIRNACGERWDFPEYKDEPYTMSDEDVY